MTKEVESAKSIQFGHVGGYTYVLLNSEPTVVIVNQLRFGQMDKEIDRQTRKRKKGQYSVSPKLYIKSPWSKWLDIRKKTPVDT
jgi:hypothetical protein